ncbi:MAG: ABC transporter permease subunit [Lachnospiraceae bacterium]|nr:ABC transporter permease subunit [Lachnospiraceae bacterium]
MDLIYAVRSEQEKTKHTPFWAIHFCIPVIGALLFLAYYFQYASTADSKKLKMILEITTTFFPLLISVIAGLNVALEEKASHFQTLLAVPCRYKNMLAKLTYLYGSGIFALFFLFLLFVIGIHLLGMADTVQFGTLTGAVIGIAFCNLIIYILHLFLSFKSGLGLSLFWGVFESLQCILYSNIRLKGIARYIPFAWSMNWIRDTLDQQLFSYGTEKIWIALLTAGGLLLALLWFSHWEGRKNYE